MKFITKSNVIIERKEKILNYETGISGIIDLLENNQGMFLSSGLDYPGRYSRWETGFFNPPIEILANYKQIIFKAKNEKGSIILNIFENILEENNKNQFVLIKAKNELILDIIFDKKTFSEENRSKQTTILTPLRIILNALKNDEKDVLGFYGAFGFDLLFQYEKIEFLNKRNDKDSFVRLFFPDEIYTLDRKKEEAKCFSYNFEYKEYKTEFKEDNILSKVKPLKEIEQCGNINSTLTDEQYAKLVEKAKEKMKVGEVFELVLRRKYFADYFGSTSNLFKKLIDINPSPYQFFCQFKDEQLIGTSPEMFVRVTGNRVETCPISGTIKRGNNPIEDEKQIKKLLNSKKDEVELTMCSDVDRNDKSRVCKSGTIRLLARRQIEKYKGLFHTVDHIEGILRQDCDGIDAFLSHMWAVTLMGAPKSTAMRLIEEYEDESRQYYGGAIGVLFCNGNINTGITIRTIHLKNNIAQYSVGASLVYDSIGEDEASETKTKATSFFNIFNSIEKKTPEEENKFVGKGLKIVVIDNQDSFVNTLSDYFRQTGASVVTYRFDTNFNVIINEKPDLIIHSPGPKLPKDFNMIELIQKITKLNIPQFGVCLGLQGIVEAFDGSLRRIEIPRQGKKWTISHNGKNIFKEIKKKVEVGAYHSFVANESDFPSCFDITASCEDGLIMGISHKEKPIWAVQFHPESIMSMENNMGYKLIENVVKLVKEYKENNYEKNIK